MIAKATGEGLQGGDLNIRQQWQKGKKREKMEQRKTGEGDGMVKRKFYGP